MTVKATEADIQAGIVSALQLCGCQVLETTTHKQKGPSGCDKGVPDLFVWSVHVPGTCLGLEVKKDEEAPRSAEQIDMERRGHYTFVWSTEMAITKFMEWLKAYGVGDVEHTVAMSRAKSIIAQGGSNGEGHNN